MHQGQLLVPRYCWWQIGMDPICRSLTLSLKRTATVNHAVIGISYRDVCKFFRGIIDGLDWNTGSLCLIILCAWTQRKLKCSSSSPKLTCIVYASCLALMLEWLYSFIYKVAQVSCETLLQLHLEFFFSVNLSYFDFAVTLRFTIRTWGRSVM